MPTPRLDVPLLVGKFPVSSGVYAERLGLQWSPGAFVDADSLKLACQDRGWEDYIQCL